MDFNSNILINLKQNIENDLLWKTCIGSSGQYTGFCQYQAASDLKCQQLDQ